MSWRIEDYEALDGGVWQFTVSLDFGKNYLNNNNNISFTASVTFEEGIASGGYRSGNSLVCFDRATERVVNKVSWMSGNNTHLITINGVHQDVNVELPLESWNAFMDYVNTLPDHPPGDDIPLINELMDGEYKFNVVAFCEENSQAKKRLEQRVIERKGAVELATSRSNMPREMGRTVGVFLGGRRTRRRARHTRTRHNRRN
jgi:hypothetical protein